MSAYGNEAGWTELPDGEDAGARPAPPAFWGPPQPGSQGVGSQGTVPPLKGGPRRGTRAPRPGPRRFTALATVVAFTVVIGAGVIAGRLVWPPQNASSGSIPSAAPSPTTSASGSGSQATGGPTDGPALARKITPALVDIDTVMAYAGEDGAGTGMVLTSSGEVLTNNHVIEGATSISVTDVGNHKTYHGTVVGYDQTHDVALVQLSDASGLNTVAVGNSDVRTGQGVVAVGNAEGVGGTPSYAGGEIVATGQTITAEDSANGTTEQLSDLLQTNAVVMPGDSGGALVDTKGQAIGMITAGTTGFQFENSTNEAFAIPIGHAVDIGRQIARKQPSSSVHIGATPFLGLTVTSNPQGGGVVIVQVVRAGPAAAAGLTSGEEITAFNGKSISTPEDLTTELLAQRVGAKVEVTYVDLNAQRHTVTVTLGSGPPQ
jgi:S1-C subfamily serine protease